MHRSGSSNTAEDVKRVSMRCVPSPINNFDVPLLCRFYPATLFGVASNRRRRLASRAVPSNLLWSFHLVECDLDWLASTPPSAHPCHASPCHLRTLGLVLGIRAR